MQRDGVKPTGVWLVVSALTAWSSLTGCGGTNVGSSPDNASGGTEESGAVGGTSGAGGGVSGTTSAQGATGGNFETPSAGGASDSVGGQANIGGQPSAGGMMNRAGAGGTSAMSGGGAGAAGSSGCISGAPCTCGTSPGTTQCADSASSCVCPTLPECQSSTDPGCFQPCGGDPFGAWVLETACYAGAPLIQGTCTSFTRASAGNNDLRMRLLDGGTLDLGGTEAWSTTTEISLSCVGLPTNSKCSSATFKAAVLLFSDVSYANCTANACGSCECKNSDLFAVSHLSGSDFGEDASWSRNGNNLNLELGLGVGPVVTPYCVQGDELWVGGTNPTDGTPKVSYKFKKESCTGTPTPCESRTSEQCEGGGDCTVGACKATAAGSALHCAQGFDANSCSVLQGCVWDPAICAGQANDTCDFGTCAEQAGCTWGPPLEKCAGVPECDTRDSSDCSDLGCSVQACSGDTADCTAIQSGSDCAKAIGCVFMNGACGGQASCSQQTNQSACANLLCNVNACTGAGTPCAQISLTDCDRMPGCRREW